MLMCLFFHRAVYILSAAVVRKLMMLISPFMDGGLMVSPLFTHY